MIKVCFIKLLTKHLEAKYHGAAGIREASEEVGAVIRQYMESLTISKEEKRADKANLQEVNELMLAMQGDMQCQLAATDEHMKAFIEQVTQLTSNVVALTKKVTEADAGGGNLRKRTKVWFAAADKENQEPNAKVAAGKDTHPPWLLKMSNMRGYC